MKRIILLIGALGILAVGFSCGGSGGGITGGGESPTEAYKRLFKAVTAKDTEAIKAEMSVKSIEFAKMAAGRNNTPVEKVFENGFTATTMNATLPEIRDDEAALLYPDPRGAVELMIRVAYSCMLVPDGHLTDDQIADLTARAVVQNPDAATIR